jgi:hypothetical protein
MPIYMMQPSARHQAVTVWESIVQAHPLEIQLAMLLRRGCTGAYDGGYVWLPDPFAESSPFSSKPATSS